MQARRKQRIIIGTLCAIIVGMVVGYAALSQVLDISGTSSIEGSFDIQITNIAENTMTGATTESTSGIGSTTANFTVDLTKPGSSAVYDVTVENKGTINAVLKSIEGINEANAASPTDIKFEVSGINTNDGLNAGISKTFQVKVTWDSTSTSIPETSKTLSLKLNYEQGSSSSGVSTVNGVSTYLLNNYLVDDVAPGEDGLVAIDDTGEVTTSSTPREYRYIGLDPNNYVSFNNELWRIIGIFDGQLKIIRENTLENMAWDSNGVNDWSTASLQIYLNGEYLNSIDNTSKSYISDYTWKLGGGSAYTGSGADRDIIITSQVLYKRERGTVVYEGRPTEWPGKIALMYASDYGFSTSGGSTMNRSRCLKRTLRNMMPEDCLGWLNYGTTIWTLTPIVRDEQNAYDAYGAISFDDRMRRTTVSEQHEIQPTLYLKAEVQIISGTGTSMDPFILNLDK